MKDTLKALHILNYENKVSVPTLFSAALIITLILNPTSLPLSLGLVFALLSLAHERHLTAKAQIEAAKIEAIKQTQVKVAELEAKLLGFEKVHESVKKMAEETKNQLAASNVSHAFGVSRRMRTQPNQVARSVSRET